MISIILESIVFGGILLVKTIDGDGKPQWVAVFAYTMIKQIGIDISKLFRIHISE